LEQRFIDKLHQLQVCVKFSFYAILFKISLVRSNICDFLEPNLSNCYNRGVVM
jgi:hypothetical protein